MYTGPVRETRMEIPTTQTMAAPSFCPMGASCFRAARGPDRKGPLRLRLPALALVCCAVPGLAQDILKASIAAVDFYGEAKVDFAQLRAASPFRVGAPIKLEDIALVPESLRKLAGDNRISAKPVFVPELNGWIVYVDIEPPDSELPAWKPEPLGIVKLPPEEVALYEHAMSRLMEGGLAAGDETTEGYSLSKDPQMRADEQKLLTYARANAAAVFDVLAHSSSGRDRIAAAWIAGYAPQNQDQIAALLQAINDPNDNVRNNAVRVLAVLAFHDARVARQIPAEPFIRMLHSPDWTDRNKAMALLDPITAARDPQTLESLRRQALAPLRQMSRWTVWGHAEMAARLLGRASGIPEDRLRALLEAKDVSTILRESER
jgi:hypothetical protein